MLRFRSIIVLFASSTETLSVFRSNIIHLIPVSVSFSKVIQNLMVQLVF